MAGRTVDRLTREGRAFFREMEKLEKLEVRVGIQEGATYPDGTPVIQVAAWNELGTSRSPARPFIRNTADKNEDKLANKAASSAKKLADGVTAENILDELGVLAKGLMQKEIKDGDFAPNAQSTINQKGSDHPLIDTGLLRQSVNYVVKRKGSG